MVFYLQLRKPGVEMLPWICPQFNFLSQIFQLILALQTQACPQPNCQDIPPELPCVCLPDSERPSVHSSTCTALLVLHSLILILQCSLLATLFSEGFPKDKYLLYPPTQLHSLVLFLTCFSPMALHLLLSMSLIHSSRHISLTMEGVLYVSLYILPSPGQ